MFGETIKLENWDRVMFFHRKKTFREEYLEFLDKFEVDYDPQYLFEFYD